MRCNIGVTFKKKCYSVFYKKHKCFQWFFENVTPCYTVTPTLIFLIFNFCFLILKKNGVT